MANPKITTNEDGSITIVNKTRVKNHKGSKGDTGQQGYKGDQGDTGKQRAVPEGLLEVRARYHRRKNVRLTAPQRRAGQCVALDDEARRYIFHGGFFLERLFDDSFIFTA